MRQDARRIRNQHQSETHRAALIGFGFAAVDRLEFQRRDDEISEEDLSDGTSSGR
jgi:hypothetical protein